MARKAPTQSYLNVNRKSYVARWNVPYFNIRISGNLSDIRPNPNIILPGLTPPTMLVPYSMACLEWNVPCLPVKPWQMTLVS